MKGHNARREAQREAGRRIVEESMEIVMSSRAIDTLKYWRERFDPPSFVYFVQEEQRGTIKIGTAVDPLARLSGLQGGNPDQLLIRELVFGTRETEQWLHQQWTGAHVFLEWFGHGYEDAILAYAAEIDHRQREAYEQGARKWETFCERVLWDMFREQAAA